MKRQLGSAPQPNLSIQNELALHKEIDDLKSTISTLHSHIAMLNSVKYTLTHENLQISNDKIQLTSSVHILETALKLETEKKVGLEVTNKTLVQENKLLIQEKDAVIKYINAETQAFCDELLDDISCQEDLFTQLTHVVQIEESVVLGDIN